MKEVEVKILNVDPEETKEKLQNAGGIFVFEHRFDALLFDDDNRSLIKSGKLLRMRKEKDGIKLTSKVPSDAVRSKVVNEYEVLISDWDTGKKLLGSLGFNEVESLSKTRVEYKLPSGKAVLDKYHDKWEHIPWLLELETDSEEKLSSMLADLEYSFEDCLPWSVKELMEHYSEK